MDFLSRDRKRQAVEELAAPSGDSQVRVALRAVESAREAAALRQTQGELSSSKLASGSTSDRAAHVGYHLVDRGRRALEADVAYRPRLGHRVRRVVLGHPTTVYLGSIALLTGLLLGAAAIYVRHVGGSTAVLAVMILLLAIPATDVAIACIQRLTARAVAPKRLPRLDFTDGVPGDARTMVIVPTMLTSVSGVNTLLEHLEVL